MTAEIITLVILGSALLFAEAHLPTSGVIGAVGLVGLAAAIVLAVLDLGGGPALAWVLTLPIAALVIAAGLVCIRKALSVSRRRARGGAVGLIGHIGVVRRPLDPIGQIAIDGELWRARRFLIEEDEPPLGEGDPVVVARVQGLTLAVRRADIWELDP
jgi:membrane-bound serine protease (ClpP class)